MKRVTRMLGFLAFGLAVVLIGLVALWYVQARSIETPRYAVLEADGEIEIRAYPALIVAEVTREGSRDTAVRSAFGTLAGYIFAKNRPGEKIAMTAPVIQKPLGSSWTIRFVMPSAYSLDRLPQPSGTDVRLLELAPARHAAIRFSGWWSDELFKAKDAVLLEWLHKRGLEHSGTPTFAYYNDPFTPGFLRRNEILYELKQ
jgi:hypothetical protein